MNSFRTEIFRFQFETKVYITKEEKEIVVTKHNDEDFCEVFSSLVMVAKFIESNKHLFSKKEAAKLMEKAVLYLFV